MTEGKRKLVTWEKLTVLKKIAGGASLAREYGIGKSTVSNIKKNKEKLKKFASGMESFSVDSKSRKIMCLANDDELDRALFYGLYRKEARIYQLTVHYWPKRLYNCMHC